MVKAQGLKHLFVSGHEHIAFLKVDRSLELARLAYLFQEHDGVFFTFTDVRKPSSFG